MAKKSATRAPAKGTTKRSPKRVPKQSSSAEFGKQSAGGAPDGFSLDDDFVERALLTGENRQLLEDYLGEDAYDELQSLARQAQRSVVRGGPRVLILPGIMGSKLGRRRKRPWNDVVWLGPAAIASGRMRELALGNGNRQIEPLGVLLHVYLPLKLRLKRAGFDADFFPYDWRRGIQSQGQQLARQIRDETKPGSGRTSLALVGHSMGGLVARAALAALGGDGEKIRRLVTLGTPHYGSFAPLLAHTGGIDYLRKLAWIDVTRTLEQLVAEIISTFVGLYQMLPSPHKFSSRNLFDATAWPSAAIPPRPDVLRSAAGIQEALAPGDPRFVQVVGVGQPTVVGITVNNSRLALEQSNDGDGTVPLNFALLEGVSTYYVAELHGSLPGSRRISQAVIDLLQTGRTTRLNTTYTPAGRQTLREALPEELAAVPAGQPLVHAPVSNRRLRHLIDEFAAPAGVSEIAVTPSAAQMSRAAAVSRSREPIVVGRKRQQRLDLRLAHGSITQVEARAIVVGLFEGVEPIGPVHAIDQRLEGAITELAQRRMFSGNIGEVFVLPTGRHLVRADMVVFAGLGLFDQLDNERLRLAAQSVARILVRTRVDEFATVLLGAGSGTELRDSIASLLKGFLRALYETPADCRLRGITLCELDGRRFEQMCEVVHYLASTPLFDEVEVTLDEVELPPETLPFRRPVVEEREPAYLVVRRAYSPNPSLALALQSSVLTAGGKATVVTDTREVDRREIDRHLRQIATPAFTNRPLNDFGTALAGLVLPDSVATVLRSVGDRHLVVLHDAEASRIPWETLCLEGWFPAAEPGMSRLYAAENMPVAKWLEERRLNSELSVLLVINPTEDLPGAQKEGDRLRKLLARAPHVHTTALFGPEATWDAVRAAFRSGDFDLVHYAGHAFFDPADRARSGILCHGGAVLSGAHLTGLERVPSLVFFNACEGGRIRRPDPATPDAAAESIEGQVGLAEALLRGGIAQYLGTYWPVNDAAADAFADSFYPALLAGEPVAGALARGRRRVREIGSADWANYIHYGSHRFALKVPARTGPFHRPGPVGPPGAICTDTGNNPQQG